MDSLIDVISDIRVFLYGGLIKLPLILAGTLLIIGLLTANYAILFFLVGYLIAVPIVNGFLRLILNFIIPKSFGKIIISDVCKLVIPYTQSVQNVKRSVEEDSIGMTYGLAMISFFIGYMIHNAYKLFSRESPTVDILVKEDSKETKKISEKVDTRKSQALISMLSIIIFGIIVIGWRYATGCETVIGLLLSVGLFSVGGFYWYKILSKVGDDRLSDLFGIANRLLPLGAISNKPVACIPVNV